MPEPTLWRECEFPEAEGGLVTFDQEGLEQPELPVKRVAAGALLIEEVPYRRALAVAALSAHGMPALAAIDIVDEVLFELTKPLPERGEGTT
jgi:hypothetical protein